MAEYENKKVMKILKDYIKKVNKKFKIQDTILFGSRARGDYLLDSDVDLIIISNDFENIEFRKRMGKLLEYWDESIDLEVLGYTQKEFDTMKKRFGLVQQAVKEGIQLG